jgi:hypothetical protein
VDGSVVSDSSFGGFVDVETLGGTVVSGATEVVVGMVVSGTVISGTTEVDVGTVVSGTVVLGTTEVVVELVAVGTSVVVVLRPGHSGQSSKA